jgi:protein gp37
MAENSKIEWTTHTFNPWVGCTKVSGACDNCYAESWAKRSGSVEWGAHGDRRLTKTWRNPVKWNKAADGAPERPRVFCASLADIFDNHKSIKPDWRADLWVLITDTPHLDWLLLTKRPQNIKRFIPSSWETHGCPNNVWLGATVENQEEFDRRVPHLIQIPARVHFLSMEPLLGPVDMGDMAGIDWVITGGESGAHYRPANPAWFQSLRDQCKRSGVPFLFKQWEGKSQPVIKAKGRALDGVVHDGYPMSAL